MEVFRLSRKKFARPLSGRGAALMGGRWNSAGVAMIYTASNRSLAMAEVAVHLTLATIPDDYVMITIRVPDAVSVRDLPARELPTDWKIFPYLPATQAIGDKFVMDAKACILRVPSAVTKGDHNLLINPRHPDFAKIRIASVEPFPIDRRIFK